MVIFTHPLQALYKGVYEDVDPTGDSFIINIGALLEDITENQIVAGTLYTSGPGNCAY